MVEVSFFSKKIVLRLTLHVSLAMELAIVFILQKSTCRTDSAWKLLMEPNLRYAQHFT